MISAITQPGFTYILEATPQLSPSAWTGIQTNAGGGPLNLTVPITATPPTRYFRLRVE